MFTGFVFCFCLEIFTCTVIMYHEPSHCIVSSNYTFRLQKNKQTIDCIHHSVPLDLVSLHSALHLLRYLVRVACSETCSPAVSHALPLSFCSSVQQLLSNYPQPNLTSFVSVLDLSLFYQLGKSVNLCQ